jgi:hypothetical protein
VERRHKGSRQTDFIGPNEELADPSPKSSKGVNISCIEALVNPLHLFIKPGLMLPTPHIMFPQVEGDKANVSSQPKQWDGHLNQNQNMQPGSEVTRPHKEVNACTSGIIKPIKGGMQPRGNANNAAIPSQQYFGTEHAPLIREKNLVGR